MKSMWIWLRVHALAVGLVLHREAEACPSAMWLAAFSSISVVQKTVSSGPMRPLAVDQRDLAQARRALVQRAGVAAEHLGALVGVDLAPPGRPRTAPRGRG